MIWRTLWISLAIVFAANIHTLRPLTDEINAQNTTRAEKCK